MEEHNSTDRSSGRRAKLLGYLLIGLASVLLYARTINYSFIWDDQFVVVQNPAIRSISSIHRYFTDSGTYAAGLPFPTYRPLVTLSYLADYQVSHLKSWFYHVHNVLLHALNACLVFWLLQQLLALSKRSAPTQGEYIAAICGTLVWAAHPVSTETVAWIKSRDELQCTFFYLLALGLLFSGLLRDRVSPTRIALITSALVCSLLSKEMAASYPLVLCLTWLFFGRNTGRKGLITTLSVSVACVVAYMIIRTRIVGATAQVPYMAGGFYHEMLTMTRASARYVRLAVAPGQLLSDYSGFFDVIRSPLQPAFVLSALLVALTLALAYVARRRVPLISYGICLFWITLLPVSNIISTMQYLAERFMYLPLFGLACVVTGGVQWLLAPLTESTTDSAAFFKQPRVRSVMLAAVLILAAEVYATSARLTVWKDPLSFHERIYRDSRPSSRITSEYAVTLFNAGLFAEALPVYRDLVQSRARDADDPMTLSAEESYGICLMLTNHMDEGLSWSLHVLEHEPGRVNTLRHVAFYYECKGDTAKALEYLQRALSYDRKNAAVQSRIAEIRRKSGVK